MDLWQLCRPSKDAYIQEHYLAIRDCCKSSVFTQDIDICSAPSTMLMGLLTFTDGGVTLLLQV